MKTDYLPRGTKKHTWAELSHSLATQESLLADLEEMAIDKPSRLQLGDRVIDRIAELKRTTEMIRTEMKLIENEATSFF